MFCTCGSDSIVKDTRRINENTGVWRKRECKECKGSFTTIEQVCETLPNKKGKPFGVPAALGKPQKRKIVPVAVPEKPILRPTHPRSVKAAPKPVVEEKEQVSRNKIEDLRMERELAAQDAWL